MTTTNFPTEKDIHRLFYSITKDSTYADDAEHIDFMQWVAPDGEFTWTVAGSTSASGTFHTRADLMNTVMKPFFGMLQEALVYKIDSICIGVNDQGTKTGKVMVETGADGVCKNGMKYPQRHCWTLQFNQDRKIVRCTQYCDTDLLRKAIEQD